jgi:hypothetical protein
LRPPQSTFYPKKGKERKRKEKVDPTLREANGDKKPSLRLGQKDIEVTWTQFT